MPIVQLLQTGFDMLVVHCTCSGHWTLHAVPCLFNDTAADHPVDMQTRGIEPMLVHRLPRSTFGQYLVFALISTAFAVMGRFHNVNIYNT